MTNELEKQFFDTFGIEPKTNREYGYKMAIYNEAGTEEIKFYPQISDSILLKLICMANQHEDYPATTNMKNIKERTLRILLRTKKCLKNTFSHKGCHNGLVRKVRTLFEEER
jgi:hypothetical protein